MSKQPLNKYQNGPVSVEIYSDGTKIREWDDEKYGKVPVLEFAESNDIKVTNMCDRGCFMCHECSTPDGKHGDLKRFMQILDKSNLPAGIEFAVGGGNPLEHPDIDEFLHYCKGKGFIVNMTINHAHAIGMMKTNNLKTPTGATCMMEYLKYALKEGLIKGLGVSITNIEQFIMSGTWKWSENVVAHLIEGICDDPLNIIQKCEHQHDFVNRNFKPKILILGWKDFGRFHNNKDSKVNEKSKRWKYYILTFIEHINKIGGVVAFDNLAVEHFDLLNRLPKNVIDTQYMGEDGTSTFYLDLVEWKFGKQSTTPKEERVGIEDKSMRDMFKIVREEM